MGEQEKVSNTDALKALAFNAVNGDMHPDQRATVEIWLDQNLTDQEKDDRLSDEQFIEKHGKTRAQYADDQRNQQASAPPSASSIPATPSDDSGDKGAATDEPEADTGGKPKSGTKK